MKPILCTILAFALGAQCDAQTITWGTPIAVSGSATGNLHPRIQLNRAGNPVVLWGLTDLYAYVSRWNGTGFTTPLGVNSWTLPVFAQSWAGPDMASFGDTIYVAMKRTPETDATHYSYLAHSYDGGATFSAPVRVDNIDSNFSRFVTVTTNAAGNPLVAFMKFDTAFMNPHYVVCRSSDYGATFSTDVLASGSAGEVCDCCPASIISSGSRAVMLFRNNLSNIRDTWAGVSTDGGATFSGTMAVDNNNWSVMSCPASGPDGVIIGDTVYSVSMSQSSGRVVSYISKASLSALATASTQPIAGTTTGFTQQNYPRIANAGNAAMAVWKQVSGGATMICGQLTENIHSGFSGFDTIAIGSGLQNADVAMTPGVIHVVYEDDGTGKLMYIKGTYPVSGLTVETTAHQQRIELYPNPTINSFYVDTRTTGTITHSYIVGPDGRRMEVTPIVTGTTAQFSTENLSPGVYYVTFNTEKGIVFNGKIAVK